MSSPSATFVEVCTYSVKPERVEELASFPGTIDVRYVRRTHRQADFASVEAGKPATRLTRAPESVTYVLDWELRDEVAHGLVAKSGRERFYARFRRCLLEAPRIVLGTRVA